MRSKIGGSSLIGLSVAVRPLWAVQGADVAEPAFLSAAAQGAAVARHHGRQTGLRRVRSNAAGSRWNTGNGAGDG